ncbi:MAG: hypothetical protein U0637_13965 [Phycisphaerales bacterium]
MAKRAATGRGAPVTPLAAGIVARARRAGAVLVYGGSFDPPHAYHAAAPGHGAALVGRGVPCLYVPAARSPFKASGPVAGDEDRVAMLRAMLRGRRGAAVWTDEVDRAAWARARGGAGPSYTVDTVRRLRGLLGDGVQVRLLIGVDQAAAFHRWRSARVLVRLAEPVVLPREGVEDGGALEALIRAGGGWAFWGERGVRAWGARVACAPLVDVSSTGIRAMLGAGGARRAGALRLLPQGVAAVVRSRGLYR